MGAIRAAGAIPTALETPSYAIQPKKPTKKSKSNACTPMGVSNSSPSIIEVKKHAGTVKSPNQKVVITLDISVPILLMVRYAMPEHMEPVRAKHTPIVKNGYNSLL